MAPAPHVCVTNRVPPTTRVSARTKIARRCATAVETIKIPSPRPVRGKSTERTFQLGEQGVEKAAERAGTLTPAAQLPAPAGCRYRGKRHGPRPGLPPPLRYAGRSDGGRRYRHRASSIRGRSGATTTPD